MFWYEIIKIFHEYNQFLNPMSPLLIWNIQYLLYISDFTGTRGWESLRQPPDIILTQFLLYIPYFTGTRGWESLRQPRDIILTFTVYPLFYRDSWVRKLETASRYYLDFYCISLIIQGLVGEKAWDSLEILSWLLLYIPYFTGTRGWESLRQPRDIILT